MTEWATLAAAGVLAAIAVGVSLALRLENPWLQPWAMARAAVQLAILALILGGVIGDPHFVAAFLAVMVVAATWVVFRRLRLAPRLVPAVAGTLVAASAIPAGVIFVSGALDFTPRFVLAMGGIIIGNTMTVATLMGRSLQTLRTTARDEVEAWLSLGATPRRAAQRLARSAASTSLIPATDQARTTGLVTLPGAFVGAIFAGATPLDAAGFQLLVLAGILGAGAVTVALFTAIFGAPRTHPIEG